MKIIMGRPRRVYPQALTKYDKFHTRKVKMFSGVEITALHLIKETDQFYNSFETWAFCCSPWKKLKYGTELQFNIPKIKNSDTVTFLKEHAWHDWVDKQLEEGYTEMGESMNFLNRLYPNKKKVYFYELKHLIAGFCHGAFIEYNDDGSIKEPHEHDLKQRRYYNYKYKGGSVEYPEHIKKLSQTYFDSMPHKFPDRDKKKQEEINKKDYEAYRKEADKFISENHDLTDVFIHIGESSVVVPYAFTHATVEGSEYEHAGEIYFVETEDTIYFETERHF